MQEASLSQHALAAMSADGVPMGNPVVGYVVDPQRERNQREAFNTMMEQHASAAQRRDDHHREAAAQRREYHAAASRERGVYHAAGHQHRENIFQKVRGMLDGLASKVDERADEAHKDRVQKHHASVSDRDDKHRHQQRMMVHMGETLQDRVDNVGEAIRNYGLVITLLQIFGVVNFWKLFKNKKKNLTKKDLPDHGSGLTQSELDQLLQKLNKLHIELHRENQRNRNMTSEQKVMNKRLSELEAHVGAIAADSRPHAVPRRKKKRPGTPA